MESEVHFPKVIATVEDLSDVITACAHRAVAFAAERSQTSNYYIGYDHMDDLITREDYLKYFDLLAAEVQGREEVLDLETEDHELNMILGTDWCKGYDPLPDEGPIVYGIRSVEQELSLAEKARRYDISQLLSMQRSSLNDQSYDSREDKRGLIFSTNRFGQPLIGSTFSPWEEAAVKKFIGPDPWCTPPKGFDPLIATDHGLPVGVYALGRFIDERDPDPFDHDLGFLNAVLCMTTAMLKKDPFLHEDVSFLTVPSRKEADSAELLAVVQVDISHLHLSDCIANLNLAMADPQLPINNLPWAKEQYALAKMFCTNFLSDAPQRFPLVDPAWLNRSIPDLAGRVCECLTDLHGCNSKPFDPEKRKVPRAIYDLFSEEASRLRKPISLTTYSRPGDPNYDAYSDESPTIEFQLPYGALREILAQDALEGEEPLTVEEFLDVYTYDYSEDIRYAYESMQRNPALSDRLLDAQAKAEHTASKSDRSGEKER